MKADDIIKNLTKDWDNDKLARWLFFLVTEDLDCQYYNIKNILLNGFDGYKNWKREDLICEIIKVSSTQKEPVIDGEVEAMISEFEEYGD
jgi:hypothetical protein